MDRPAEVEIINAMRVEDRRAAAEVLRRLIEQVQAGRLEEFAAADEAILTHLRGALAALEALDGPARIQDQSV